jgi:hypothetical protein
MIYIVVFILMSVVAWISFDLHNQDLKNENKQK